MISERENAAPAPRYAWVILAVVFLASMAAPLNQAKVPPVMPVLIEALHIDLSTAGMLMSVFALTGVILALPAGMLLQRYGPKVVGLAALAFLAAGATVGALASGAGVLLGGRLIEGFGMGLTTVVGPAAIAMWFPAARRGLPMGLWATWVPVGNLIMFNTAPQLATAYSWRAVWWAGAAFAALLFVVYAVLFRAPAPDSLRGQGEAMAGATAPAALAGLRDALANRDLWLISLSFLWFNVAALGLGTYLPTFLNTVRGYTLAGAAAVASLMMVASLISSPLAGWVSDRIGSRKKTIIMPLLILAVLYVLPFNVPGRLVGAAMLAIGFLGSAVPTSTFAAVPELVRNPRQVGMGMAVLAMGQNLGMFIGPWVVGKLIETTSWTTASLFLLPVCLIAAGIAALVKVR